MHNMIKMDFFHLHLGDVFPPNSQTTRGADFVVGSLKTTDVGGFECFLTFWKRKLKKNGPQNWWRGDFCFGLEGSAI